MAAEMTRMRGIGTLRRDCCGVELLLYTLTTAHMSFISSRQGTLADEVGI